MNPQRAYVAFTPYHLLLALALQDRDGYPNATVLFADEARFFTHAPEIGAAVEAVVGLHTGSTLEMHPAWEYPVRARLAARAATRLVQAMGPPPEIFVFHGLRPEAQRFFAKLEGDIAFNFVEDGFDSYIAVNRDDVPLWHRAVHRMLCGSPRARSHDMISAFPYASYHVIAPELCRAPQPLVKAIPVDNLRRATEILRSGMSLPRPERTITDLYLLANSERMSDPFAYLRAMRTWVERRTAVDPDTYTAVKAHPREKNRELMAGVHELGDYTVPHWVPAELLTGLLSPDVAVHTGLTTFIISSRQLLPERRLYLDETVRREHAEILQRWDPSIGFEADDVGDRPIDEAFGRQP